jgi:toxin ParE1/3/4
VKRLYLSARARADIQDIWRYSQETWGTAQANRYLEAIGAMLVRIDDGTAVPRRADDIAPHLFRIAVGRHTIFLRDNGERIEVVRVLHQNMDIGRRV